MTAVKSFQQKPAPSLFIFISRSFSTLMKIFMFASLSPCLSFWTRESLFPSGFYYHTTPLPDLHRVLLEVFSDHHHHVFSNNLRATTPSLAPLLMLVGCLYEQAGVDYLIVFSSFLKYKHDQGGEWLHILKSKRIAFMQIFMDGEEDREELYHLICLWHQWNLRCQS